MRPGGLSNTNRQAWGENIGSLKQAAKVREKFDRVYERQLLGEQEQDRDAYGDTERSSRPTKAAQMRVGRGDRRMDEVEASRRRQAWPTSTRIYLQEILLLNRCGEAAVSLYS